MAISKQAVPSMDFKHSGSTRVEGLPASLYTISRLSDQLLWSKEPVAESEGISLREVACGAKNHLIVLRSQKAATFVLQTGRDRVLSVCERWWDRSTAYPLITSTDFSLRSPSFRPPAAVRTSVSLASALIAPTVCRMQSLASAKVRSAALLVTVWILAIILLTVGAIQREEVVPPVVCGLAAFTGTVVLLVCYTNSQLHRAYYSLSSQLESFCAAQSVSTGFRITAVGPFALVYEPLPQAAD